MTANPSIDPVRFLSEHLERAEPDLLRSMLMTFVNALMGAEADALCGAPYVRRTHRGAGQLPQRIPGPGVWSCSLQGRRRANPGAGRCR